MLDRILNINPQDKYKSGVKISNHPYAVNRHDHDKNNSKDSALISPLARLLSKINWEIIKIEYPSNDEILLNFLVNDLEFLTVVNLNDINEIPLQEFLIYKTTLSQNLKIRTEIKLLSKKQEISIINRPDPIITENIEYLFNRIGEFTNYETYSSSEKIVLNNFIFGFEKEINEELDYILHVIYTFISTRFQSKIKNNSFLKTEGNIPIIMQEVAIIHAE
jgi:hypothetical protein